MKNFTHYRQADLMDCGPTCLRMIARHYGRNFTLQRLRDISGISRDGVSMLGISQAAEKVGFRTTGIKTSINMLVESELPCILHWRKNHFVVLYKITRHSIPSKRVFHISDPAYGLLTYNQAEFAKNWISMHNSDEEVGVALVLTPTPSFLEQEGDLSNGLSLTYILSYLVPYKKLIIQLIAGLATGSLLQLILPFIMQSVVDIGINTRNINFVSIILIAQTMLFIGRLSVDFIRSWILLHITARINISILTDFLIKIFKLPISFFETKMTGDIMQRMEDQGRIQSFLTGSSLGTFFSLFNLVIFAFVLSYYNFIVFTVFIISSVLYSLWVILFLKKRRTLDFKRFEISSENQSNIVQLISGMQEIKLNNCEQQKRWQWEHIQARLFKYNIKSLALGQYQQLGAFFINESKNIIITFMVARAVIDGQLTIGGMMAIQYIVGQLNSPIEQLVSFFQAFQDAKISLERLNEVHSMKNEESTEQRFINSIPSNKSISLHDITFSYPGAGSDPVLKRISLHIPEGKTTAIVGMSGSGKTTILKLLLRFHETLEGEIRIGNTNLSQIGYRYWRGLCGAVMQDGFIFSDTIANNIAVADESLDIDRLNHALQVANIHEFIDNLPLGLNTKIGAAGNGISQGQRQRILIARAVYKEPEFIFFDEATNALDANNEKVIIENLNSFFKGRTVVIVAHRLSTVKNADNIVVLDRGVVIEQGNHKYLTALKGEYFKLVKNQLDLGD